MTTIRFETESCRRCGGTGLHSFNRTDGSVCYGCSGRGVARTENAKQATEMLKKLAAELASVAAAELEPGDVIRQNGRKSGWSTVVSVAADELNAGRVDVVLEGNRHVNYPGDTVLRRQMTDEEWAEFERQSECLWRLMRDRDMPITYENVVAADVWAEHNGGACLLIGEDDD